MILDYLMDFASVSFPVAYKGDMSLTVREEHNEAVARKVLEYVDKAVMENW